MKSASGASLRVLRVLRALLAALLAALLVALLVTEVAEAHTTALCKPEPAPDFCQFGLTRDFCGRPVCAKGPGERCGGPSQVHGRCGEGMHCKCERCIGCSLHTFTCDLGSSVCI